MENQDERPRLREWLLTIAKLGLSGAVIVAIAFAFVAFDNPKGEVQQAEADLWDAFVRQSSKNERFMQTLKDEGMSPPRQYDHNGNQVYFSYATTRESPEQVMLRFQQAFYEEGVNTYFHDTVREAIPPGEVEDVETVLQGYLGLEEFFSGGLVPIYNTRNRMAMVGIDTKEGAKHFHDALLQTNAGMRRPEDVMGAFRYLDATREERSRETTITAVWSDEQLDLNRFKPESKAAREGTVDPIELTIPICRGCQRVSRLSGTGHEEGQHTILYRSRQSIHDLVSFYDRTMGQYGWETEPVVKSLNQLLEQDMVSDRAAQFRSYRKDGLNLTMIVYYDSEDYFTYVKMVTIR